MEKIPLLDSTADIWKEIRAAKNLINIAFPISGRAEFFRKSERRQTVFGLRFSTPTNSLCQQRNFIGNVFPKFLFVGVQSIYRKKDEISALILDRVKEMQT